MITYPYNGSHRLIKQRNEMQIEYYTDVNDLPLQMVKDLVAAQTADKAEMVFHAWRDKGVFVEARERAVVWMKADEALAA
jgi:hypothetical protein